MKTKIECFTPMSAEQLLETNGGGFAFDIGRIIRFIGVAFPGDVVSTIEAINDWHINQMINAV